MAELNYKQIDEILNSQNIYFEKPWQIITVRELEIIIPLCSKERPFIRFLNDKINDKDKLLIDWDKFFSDQNIEIVKNKMLRDIMKNGLEK